MSETVWIINQYASTPSTGIGGRHYYMAREMAKRGYNVYIIGSAAHHILREKPVVKEDFLLEELDGFKFVWVKMPDYKDAHSKQRALNWFLFPWRIRKLANFIKDKPDAILSSSPSLLSFLGTQRLAKKMRARLVFEVRDIWPLTLTEIGGFSSKHPFIRLMQWVEDKAYRDADAIISNLKNSVEHMSSRGLDRTKFNWVPNGFSLDEVNQKAPLNALATNQLPRNKFIVGYTGTMGVANALDTLIDAADQLKDRPDIVFVLVGTGKEKAALKALVEERELKNVFFVDPIPKVEIQSMLNRFDACYIGWLNDPIYQYGIAANKIFDYLYSSKPIIHAYSGACDPVAEAQAGVQLPAQDSDKLAEAVLKLYQMTPVERAEMGENGRKAALAQYEYGQLAEKLAGVLFDR
jgi:glycosyltransferase involved in cell wall biosynthesis